MITAAYAQTMARYNAWQNQNLYEAAALLQDAERKADRGAFFGSIHATLNHLVWADHFWLHRFKVKERPIPKTITDGLTQYTAWEDLRAARRDLDAFIEVWAGQLRESDLAEPLTWYAASAQRDMVTPMWVAVTHFFNHQTHHRGQVHCLITGLGGKPHRTDLPFLPALLDEPSQS